MRSFTGRVLEITTGCRFIQGFQDGERIEFGRGKGVTDEAFATGTLFSVSQQGSLVDGLDGIHGGEGKVSAGIVQSGRRSFRRSLDRREKDALFGDLRARTGGGPGKLASEMRGDRAADIRQQLVAGGRHDRGQNRADEA